MRRVMHGGLAAGLSMSMEFEPEAEGSRVRVRIDAELAGGQSAHIESMESHPDQVALERAVRAFREQAVGAGERDAAERLIRLVAEGPDTEVERMRPFELADAWAMDRRQVLEAYLLSALLAPGCASHHERRQLSWHWAGAVAG